MRGIQQHRSQAGGVVHRSVSASTDHSPGIFDSNNYSSGIKSAQGSNASRDVGSMRMSALRSTVNNSSDLGNKSNNMRESVEVTLMDKFFSSSSPNAITDSLDGIGAADDQGINYQNSDSQLVKGIDPNYLGLNNLMRQKGKSQKLVSGSQFRLITKGENHRCENCDEIDKLYKKSKETIRSLKVQIVRLEDDYCGLKKSKVSDAPRSLAVDGYSFEDVLSTRDGLQKKCDDQEVELSRLRKLMTKERSQYEELTEKYQRKHLEHQHQKESFDQSQLNLKSENIDLSASVSSLKTTIIRMQEYTDLVEIKLADCMRQLQSKSDIPDYSQEVERLRKENFNVIENNKTLGIDMIRLNKTIIEVTNSLSKQTAVNKESEEIIKQKSALLADAMYQLETLRHDNDAFEREKKRHLIEKECLDEQFAKNKQEIDGLASDKATLNSEIEQLNIKIAELWRRMLNDSEATKKALELAIAGSLRLCVVAPTVNVHVSDRKLRFKSSLSEKNLREFLLNEVLAKYSFLFKQSEEDAAPDGTALQKWIQKMLGDMQASIEQHVNSAMDGSN